MEHFNVKHAGDLTHALTVTHHLDCSPAVVEVLREVRKITFIAVAGWAAIVCIRGLTARFQRRD